MRYLLAALQFLTILPVRGNFSERTLGRSMVCFPLVGLLIGGIVAIVDHAGLQMGMHPILITVFSVGMLAALTGGLHLDGLADTADGFLSARPRERVLEIMRDSRIGTMGALALFFALALKIAALATLSPGVRWRALLLAPLAGRSLMTLTICVLSYARQGGMAEVFVKARRSSDGLWAISFSALLTILLFGIKGLSGIAICATGFAAMTFWSRRRIGGFTGDTLGATSEVTEVLVLIFASICFAGGIR